MNSNPGLASSFPDDSISGSQISSYRMNNYGSYLGYGYAARPSSQLQGYHYAPNIGRTPEHFGQGYNMISSPSNNMGVDYSRSLPARPFLPPSYTVHHRPHMQWPTSQCVPQWPRSQLIPQWPRSQTRAHVPTFDQCTLHQASAHPVTFSPLRTSIVPNTYSSGVAAPSTAQLLTNHANFRPAMSNYSPPSRPTRLGQLLPTFTQPPPVSHSNPHSVSHSNPHSGDADMQPLDLSTKHSHWNKTDWDKQVRERNSHVGDQKSSIMDQNIRVMDENIPNITHNIPVWYNNVPVRDQNSPDKDHNISDLGHINRETVQQTSHVTDDSSHHIPDSPISTSDCNFSDQSTEYRLMRFCDCFKGKQEDCQECFFPLLVNEINNTCLDFEENTVETTIENAARAKVDDTSHTGTDLPTVERASAQTNTALPTAERSSAHTSTATPTVGGSNQSSALIATTCDGAHTSIGMATQNSPPHTTNTSPVTPKGPGGETANSGQPVASVWSAQANPSQPMRLTLYKTPDEKSSKLGLVPAPVAPPTCATHSADSCCRVVEGRSICEEHPMASINPLQSTHWGKATDSCDGWAGLVRYAHKLPPVIKRRQSSNTDVSKPLSTAHHPAQESSRVREVENVRSQTSEEESVLNMGSTQFTTGKRLKADVFESEDTVLRAKVLPRSDISTISFPQTREPTKKKNSVLQNRKRKLLSGKRDRSSSFTDEVL